MITLHTFPGRNGLESLSPFCMKVEVYLKLTKTPYTAKLGGDPRKAPKGKMPFIKDGSGAVVADSTEILRHLESASASPLDAGITDLERARAHVLQRMLEEGLYFVMLYTRWAEEDGWRIMKGSFKGIPAPIRLIVAPLIRKKTITKLAGQGTGLHSRAEIYELGCRDIDSLASLLGDGPYFLGETLRTIDVTAYAFLANILKFDVDTDLKARVKSKPNLVAFVDRVAGRVAAAA